MKSSIEKVYTCEYCGKKMFSAPAMSLHERMCKHNPKNKHKCFEFCKHCSKEYIEISVRQTTDIPLTRNDIAFVCEKRKVKMYSYKLERYFYNHPRTKGLERMPLECEYYEYDKKYEMEEG